LLPESWHTDRAEKTQRLYAKFCADAGLKAAENELVVAALEFHRISSSWGVGAILAHAQAEVKLCEAAAKAERIMQNASIAAAEWAKTDSEPLESSPSEPR
jgi:hypothetical protein